MKIKTFEELKAWNRKPTIEKPTIAYDFFFEFGNALEKDDIVLALEIRFEYIVYNTICYGKSYEQSVNIMKSDFEKFMNNNRRFKIRWENFEGDR